MQKAKFYTRNFGAKSPLMRLKYMKSNNESSLAISMKFCSSKAPLQKNVEYLSLDLRAHPSQDKLLFSEEFYKNTKAKLIDSEDQPKLRQISQDLRVSKPELELHSLEEKIKVYRDRVEFLQKIANLYSRSGEVSKFQLSSQEIELLVKDGHEIKRILRFQEGDNPALENLILWVENLAHKIRKKIEEINSVSTIETLDHIPRIIFGFVDISKEIIEKSNVIMNNCQLPQVIRPELNFSEEYRRRESPRRISGKKIHEQQIYSELSYPERNYQHSSPDRKIIFQLCELEKRSDSSHVKLRNTSQPRGESNILNTSSTIMRYVNPTNPSQHEEPEIKQRIEKIAPIKNKIDSTQTEVLEIIVRLQEILENYGYPLFDRIKSLEIARQIVYSFPMLINSKLLLSNFALNLTNALKTPKIYQKLVGNVFSVDILSNLIGEGSHEFKNDTLAHCYEEHDHADELKIDDRNHESLKKKLKKEEPSQLINVYATPLTNFTIENQVKKQDRTQDIEKREKDNKITYYTNGLKRTKSEEYFNKHLDCKRGEAEVNQKPLTIVYGNREPFVEQPRRPIEMENIKQNNFDKNLCEGKENIIFGNNSMITIKSMSQGDTPIICTKSSSQSLLTEPSEHIHKIFSGALKCFDKQPIQNIGLYSCDSIEKLSIIPKILAIEELLVKIDDNIDYMRFHSKMMKLLNTFDPLKQSVICGWIESENDYSQAECDSLAISLLENNKVGVLKYGGCVKVYFMHRNQIIPEWIQWLKFIRRKLRKNSCSRLCFLLVFQKTKTDSCSALSLKLLKPEKIIPYREDKFLSIIENQSTEKHKHFQKFIEENSPEHTKRALVDRVSTSFSNKHQQKVRDEGTSSTNFGFNLIDSQTKNGMHVEESNTNSKPKSLSGQYPGSDPQEKHFPMHFFQQKSRVYTQHSARRMPPFKHLDSQEPSSKTEGHQIDSKQEKDHYNSFSANTTGRAKRGSFKKEPLYTPSKIFDEQKILYGSNTRRLFLNSESDITSDRKSFLNSPGIKTYTPYRSSDREKFSYSRPPIQFKSNKICIDKDSVPILPMWERMTMTPKKETDSTLLMADPYNIDFTDEN